MFVQVTAKNVGGVFYETQCTIADNLDSLAGLPFKSALKTYYYSSLLLTT